MDETWVGFSGSDPFGSVAYDGAMAESTRGGDDAQPASSHTASRPCSTTQVVYRMRPARPPGRRNPVSRAAHNVSCATRPRVLPRRTHGWLTTPIDSSL